ncbi:MAG: hypothetical protein AAF902_05495 [Chloroflexota bacterium]
MKRSTKFFFFGLGIGLGLSAREIVKQSAGIIQTVAPMVFDWLGKGTSVPDAAAELEASGKRNMQQLMEKMPTEHNYRKLNHLIGIERWGHRRIKTALGETAVIEEYDSYRPAFGLSWNELQDIYQVTRDETLNLANAIEEKDASDIRVMHNEFGKITAKEWLIYLKLHANAEIWKMN